MNQTTFFKPTIWKILIAILLLFPISNTTCSSMPPQGCTTAYLPLTISFVNGIPAQGITLNPFGVTGQIAIILILLGIIISYVLSCSAIHIYFKVKGKRVKK